MLSYLYATFTSSCPQYVRHMDYLNEILAMRGRARRYRTAWQDHLERSREAVLSAAQRCGNRRKAVILGAGALHDVPLGELSGMFREVVLLDIVLLPEVRRLVRRYNNVKLVQHDMTNATRNLFDNVRLGRNELPASEPAVPEIDADTGLVVSLNVLSQLWIIPRAYALGKLRGLEVERVDEWCVQIVEAHTIFLKALPCDACLIADHAFIKRDREGKIVSRGSTVAGFELPDPEVSWTWNILPSGGKDAYFSKELTVGVWNLRRDTR